MTRRAAGLGRGTPRVWLLPVLVLTSALAASAAGLLSRSLVLDLVAWWPVWVVMAVLAVVGRKWKIGRIRLAGLVPLLTLAALGAFVVGHVQGWPVTPSSSAHLVGPPVAAATQAELSARVDGVIELRAGSEFLYEVGPVRRGGDIAIPESVERSLSDAITVVLGPPETTGYYRFAGWDIRLSPDPTWALSLEGELEVDLSGLTLSEVHLSGSGLVTIGATSGPVSMTVNGPFEVVVASGTPVQIVGDAVVPVGWQRASDGWMSPIDGDGWLITISEASSVVVTEP